MSQLVDALVVTGVGMTVVLAALVGLAVTVKLLGQAVSSAERSRTRKQPEAAVANPAPKEPAEAVSDRRFRLRAAVIAAVIADMNRSGVRGRILSVQPLGGWRAATRAEAVNARARFMDRKEHRSWSESTW